MLKLNRRILLRGLGGALVAAPYLGSLFERSAKASVSTGPKRTILMFTHYGCITNRWFPKKLDGQLTAEDLRTTSLSPLAPFASKLLLPRGIRLMNEWTADNLGPGQGLGQGNETHLQQAASALTCQPVTPNFNVPFSFANDRHRAMPIGPSLDHVIAQQLSASGEPLLMSTAGIAKDPPLSAVSYAAAETVFGALDAVQAYGRLTGLFGPGAAQDTWEAKKGRALADIVRGDLADLQRRDMSRDDRHKLEQWLDLANTVHQVVVANACNQLTAMALGANATLGTGDGDALTRKVSDTMDNADLYSAIAAMAAACNASPVIVLKYPASFVFSGLGIDANSDHLAHRQTEDTLQGPCAPNPVENLLRIDAYYAQKFALLVKMLDSVAEDGGSLLDNSVAVWMSDASDGCARNLNNMPIVQAGSGGGYFKTGKIIHLDAGSGATAEDMLGRSLDQCFEGNTDVADGRDKATGTDARFGNRPVNKYFCNIMKAMGLRADADGFPAKDGPGPEVTHFGYSDKTEDFCGGVGGVPDARIHDPGAFGELEA